jgi:hypothetical protein
MWTENVLHPLLKKTFFYHVSGQVYAPLVDLIAIYVRTSYCVVVRDETGSDTNFRIRIVSVGTIRKFSDSETNSDFFFSETKTNTVRVLSVGIGKRSETIRIFFRISGVLHQPFI